MKKQFIQTFRIYAFCLLLPFGLMAQKNSAKVFFGSDTIPAVYLGIDFTKAKLINDPASNPVVIQQQQFQGINFLIIKESKKYDVQGAYHRKSWTEDLTLVDSRNQKADPNQLMSSNEGDLTRLDQKDIASLVSGFDFGSHKGYGALLVVEGMSKTKKLITIWFTVIDMNSKKLLFADRVEGKLGQGFGFRNYWASAIKSAIKQADNRYDDWKSGAAAK